MIGIHCWDALEKHLPDVGVLRVTDAETQQQYWVDTSSAYTRTNYRTTFEEHLLQVKELFQKAGADFLSLGTHEPYVPVLLRFFQQRLQSRIQHG